MSVCALCDWEWDGKPTTPCVAKAAEMSFDSRFGRVATTVPQSVDLIRRCRRFQECVHRLTDDQLDLVPGLKEAVRTSAA